jgi:hypothetical protein
MSVISLQWGLNETAGSSFSIAKGLIKAASSDNIQALALITCEAFGSTLAICQETCMKVERIAGMHHQSLVVKFLKSQIGYSAGDSAAQLSLSSAGVRFLSLAAALGTLGAFNGAIALESMISQSARDQQFLPTVIQLKDLLNVIEYKLVRAGFAESLAGWTIWFANNPLLEDGERMAMDAQRTPSADEVEQLVNALRELGRLGDAIKVTISVVFSAPWVTTFIKWSLGMPPSITSKNGTYLLEQPGSPITLVVASSMAMRISISRQMDTPAEIIEVALGRDFWSGMVSVRTYAQYRLQQNQVQSDLAKRAVLEGLIYAIKQTSLLLRPLDLSTYDPGTQAPSWKRERDKRAQYDTKSYPMGLVHMAGTMFPNESVLSSTLSEYMGVEIDNPLPTLSEGTLITDLPLVTLYRDSVKKDCKCAECVGESAKLYTICMGEKVLSIIGSLVADVLALSLLDCTEPVLLYIKRSPRANQFEKSVHAVLSRGQYTPCRVEDVIDWALGLVGHDVSPLKEENWIMSSYRGQVFYPRLFETETLEREGLLVMSGAPGALRHGGLVYNKTMSNRYEHRIMAGTPDAIMSKLVAAPVVRPLNLLQEHSIKWEVTRGDNMLHISLLSTCSHATFNPFAIICGAVQSLYIEHCPHSPDTPLIKPDPFATYTSPFYPWGEKTNNRDEDKIGVVAVHGNESLRMLSLVSGIGAVVQQNACLQCSLDVCRSAGYSFVIDGRYCEDRADKVGVFRRAQNSRDGNRYFFSFQLMLMIDQSMMAVDLPWGWNDTVMTPRVSKNNDPRSLGPSARRISEVRLQK